MKILLRSRGGSKPGDLVVQLRPVSHHDLLALLGHETIKYGKKVLFAGKY